MLRPINREVYQNVSHSFYYPYSLYYSFSLFTSIFFLFFFFKQKTAYDIGLGIPAEPLFRSPDTNKIPKHLFQGYLNIYNNYFKAPWMPDRTEANPNELNQDDARYGFRCCHLKNIWTAPLPPETELSRQMTTS